MVFRISAVRLDIFREIHSQVTEMPLPSCKLDQREFDLVQYHTVFRMVNINQYLLIVKPPFGINFF